MDEYAVRMFQHAIQQVQSKGAIVNMKSHEDINSDIHLQCQAKC